MKTKKNKKIQNTGKRVLNETNMNNDLKQIVTILLSVIIFFLIVYLITAIVKGEIKFGTNKKEKEPTEIQYQEILIGETFNKPDSTYYVLFMDFTDTKLTYLMTLVDTYTKKENASYIYYVDLEKGFNSPFRTEDASNPTASSAKELKVKSPTMIKISNKQNTEYIEGYDKIEEMLTNLSK